MAREADHYEAAQIWTFVQSLYDPPAPPFVEPSSPLLSPLHFKSHALPHSYSAPASIPTIHSASQSPVPSLPMRSSTMDAFVPGLSPHHSPLRELPSQPPSASPSPRRAASPLSTAGASPASVLSALSGSGAGSMRGSLVFPRRPSNVGILRPRALSSYTRPSLTSMVSASSSLKHVGEGALDDSDSESGGSSGNEDASPASEPTDARPALVRRPSGALPSPLSQPPAADSDDARSDGDTPSPRSTDSGTDSAGVRSVRLLARRKSRSRQPQRKPRASSRTPAALPAQVPSPPAPLPLPPLLKRASRSSMRTVMASGEPEYDGGGPARPGSVAAMSVRSQRILSGGSQGPPADVFRPASVAATEDGNECREQRLLARGWVAVRAALDAAADGGDVQTAAVLALVCAHELGLTARRVVRIVESYVGASRTLGG
jgi:hypothetical protein